MDQFWSPLTNELEGPYGGSLQNRLRFTFDVLTAIRKRVGPEFIVGIRYTGDEVLAGGLQKEEGLQISQLLKDSGMIDFLNVIRGNIATDAGLTDIIPIQGMRNAPHLDFAGEIKTLTGFPTFHAAKIPDVATARHAIASGLVDMVGMTRAHMTDPHIVRKIIEGREDDIRPCVGANYCLDRIYNAGAAYCIHNAATGRETTMPHEIPKAVQKRKVVIIGAGPGAWRRHVWQASAATRWWCTSWRINRRADSPNRTVRAAQGNDQHHRLAHGAMRALGVRFHFNTWADTAIVLDENADVVIVATGGMPHTEVLEHGNQFLVSSWDIISGDVKPGRNVLVYDDAGDHAGLQAAEFIARSGAKTEIMTPDRSFAPEVMGMNLVPYMRALQHLDTTFTVTYRLKAVEKQGDQLLATIGTDYSDLTKTRLVDQVVVNHGTRPLDELYFDLKPLASNEGALEYMDLIVGKPQTVVSNPEGRFQLFRIGDAVASRNTHAAIYDALRLVKDL